jgi:hypothetical protein
VFLLLKSLSQQLLPTKEQRSYRIPRDPHDGGNLVIGVFVVEGQELLATFRIQLEKGSAGS